MTTIVRWNPIREIEQMQRAFDEAFRGVSGGFATVNAGSHALALDVHEDEKGYRVVTALPGVKADDIHVEVEYGVLSISAEINEEKTEGDGKRALLRERRYGKFSRRLRLPQTINANAIDAQYQDGVLTLNLPKAEEAKPRLIPVKVAS